MIPKATQETIVITVSIIHINSIKKPIPSSYLTTAGLMNIKRTKPKQRQVAIDNMYNNLFMNNTPCEI